MPVAMDSGKPELLNRVALITGAGRGIGEAIALAFAQQGAKLVLSSRTEHELEAVATKARALGAAVVVAPGDVSKIHDVNRLVARAVEQYGSIDVLVNAAAIHGPIGRMWETDPTSWVSAIQVNLIGTYFCCRAAIRYMIANRRGKIINFSGGGGTSPSPFLSAYGVSKAAVVRLTETLAAELSEYDIQVNAIAPGMVDTSIHDDLLKAGNIPNEVLAPVRLMRQNGGGSVPKEIPAKLAVFLASSRSDCLSGKLIAAPYDNWQEWDRPRIEELMGAAWLTLRRMDSFTLKTFMADEDTCVKKG
jgi:NAD(P)-dependent dehydrogenase (short-subunit alcohol dehydrogenase family)